MLKIKILNTYYLIRRRLPAINFGTNLVVKQYLRVDVPTNQPHDMTKK